MTFDICPGSNHQGAGLKRALGCSSQGDEKALETEVGWYLMLPEADIQKP